MVSLNQSVNLLKMNAAKYPFVLAWFDLEQKIQIEK